MQGLSCAIDIPACATVGIALGVGVIAFARGNEGKVNHAPSNQEDDTLDDEAAEVPVEAIERMIDSLRRRLPPEAMEGTTDEEIKNAVVASMGGAKREGYVSSYGGLSGADLDEINIAQLLGFLLFIIVCFAALFLLNTLSKGALMQVLRGLFPKELKLLGLI
jgi:anti-sigma factor RsiW